MPPKDFVFAVVSEGSCWNSSCDSNLVVGYQCHCARKFETKLFVYYK
jgi:hypothetical protein